MDVGRLREHSRVLGFTPQDEVRWLAPGELMRTAIKVGLSSLFADYADRREVQAALPATTIALAPDADGGLWLDHVADLGDGFDPTYTVARLLAADTLEVGPPEQQPGEPPGPPLLLPRGRLLVLGGDEVYPTPSSSGYEDRMKGPYRAALPSGAVDPAPIMVALPGNHDWYDGLTAFLRLFAQRRPLGGWRTVQTRSYFAVQLPQRWWLVGVDTQLGTYIDDPQMRYFREHLSAQLQPGDGVVLAVPSPTWVHTGEHDADAFNALHYFEREVVENHRDVAAGTSRPTGARVRLWLTGDLHHYARYEEVPAPGESAAPGSARQFVTCGLGGAYLLDTHRLPDTLELPSPHSRMVDHAEPARFELRSPWPTKARSRRLVAGLLAGPPRGLPWRNPGFWRLVGGVHAVLLLALLFTLGLEQGRNLTGVLRLAVPADVAWFAGQCLAWAGVLYVMLALRPLAGLHRPRAPSEVFWAGLAQLVVGLAGMVALVAVPWPTALPDWVVLALAVVATASVTGLVGAYVFAGYVALSRLPTVQGWQLSAQALEECKGFLRLRIDPSGLLTVYPVAVDDVCHDWVIDGPAGGAAGSARPVPAGAFPRPHLIEQPVVVDRDPGRALRGVQPGAQPATTS